MPNLQLPLSGDVTQTINPWTWFMRAVGNQFGLININLGKTSNPELEERILNEVGTYGRQLGQIGDALAVLLAHVRIDELSADELRAIRAFQYQHAEIERLKIRHHAERQN
ncbi:MAG: hypothetical protein Q7J47_01610 [Azoarcus sp.]|nr:hypothetical protein [Azoarcus sp.]